MGPLKLVKQVLPLWCCRLACGRQAEVARERDQALRALKSTLVGQIQLCERLLGRDVTDSGELGRSDEETLRALAQHLERELAELR